MRLARASLRVTATISHALSPPEPESPRRTTVSSSHGGRRSLSVPVSPAGSLRRRHPEGPGEAPFNRPRASPPVNRLTAWRAGRLSETSPYASVHDSREGRLVLTLTSYTRSAAAWLRVLPRRRRHITARFAPVAPQGDRYALGEHGSLCRRFGRHARHGAPSYGAWRLCNSVLTLGYGAVPAPRPTAEWRLIGLAPTTIPYQIFFASKGSVCWSLLVSGPAFFASSTASRCSVNAAKHLGNMPPASPQLYRRGQHGRAAMRPQAPTWNSYRNHHVSHSSPTSISPTVFSSARAIALRVWYFGVCSPLSIRKGSVCWSLRA